MHIIPAIDLYDHKAVRLLQGDYQKMTIYSENPAEIAEDFADKGVKYLHMVDLEGAKDGTTPNLDVVAGLAGNTGLSIEIGGGIRSMETINAYFEAGVDRVILGTAAITDEALLKEALWAYGDAIVVGADIKDGKIAIKGWLETAAEGVDDFFTRMETLGVATIIVTDVSKDGMMGGTNLDLYRRLNADYAVNIVASGGVSSLEDIVALRELGMYGAIVGKAYYTGAIDLEKAIEAAREG